MQSRLLGSVLLISTFIAGGLAGAAAVRVVSAEKTPTVRIRSSSSPMRGGPRRLLLDEQFSKQLGLTADQRAKIKVILDRRDAQAKQMWDGFEPQLKAFGQQVHDEIATVLTADQQKKLDAAIEQRREKWKQQRQGCPPGNPKT